MLFRSPNNVSILLGDGTGSFGPATNFPVGTNPLSLAIADFNSDGKLDIAVANVGTASNNVSILLGTGTGSFGPAGSVVAGIAPRSVAIGDFNSDGKSDLAVANAQSEDVSILLGDGTGSFGPATNFDIGTQPIFVAIGDFNSDGKPDIVTANDRLGTVSILLHL